MRLFKPFVLTISFLLSMLSASAQQTVVPLYIGVPPGSEGKSASEAVTVTPQGEHIYSSIHKPSITIYLPDSGIASGVGVLVIPGGGHKEIWADHEGFRVAEWLSKHGIAAFVLKYRLAREAGSTYTVEGTELDDTRQAMRIIRQGASKWGIDPARLGVMGFSAGGELAALVSTRPDSGATSGNNTAALQSSRPAFQVLMYPAIPKEMPLSKETPPAFLACGANDDVRISEGVPDLYLKMQRAGTSAEMHIFAGVGHGFGIRRSNPANVREWPDLFYAWLDTSGFLHK